jgi:hypothetical protein
VLALHGEQTRSCGCSTRPRAGRGRTIVRSRPSQSIIGRPVWGERKAATNVHERRGWDLDRRAWQSTSCFALRVMERRAPLALHWLHTHPCSRALPCNHVDEQWQMFSCWPIQARFNNMWSDKLLTAHPNPYLLQHYAGSSCYRTSIWKIDWHLASHQL